MLGGLEAELQNILDEIVSSPAHRKVIVAGPGTGKTTLFRRLVKAQDGQRDSRLVLTFINNLKTELDEALGQMARVFTFHAYCARLLHRRPLLRSGLSEDFRYYPALPTLIASDWRVARGLPVPKFVGLMRQLEAGEPTRFYFERADYYDAVSFDDSVFRAHRALDAHPDEMEAYEVVLIDEYQDFNRLEASLLDLLATRSPIVIAGDDDQALYSLLRSSSPEFIRARFGGSEYQRFVLPFCMRCPEVVVLAVGDIVARAQARGSLRRRIDKPYRTYPPRKGADSARYPRLKVVETSVQSLKVNYFGRYIAESIDAIPAEDIAESHAQRFPTVLVIGPKQYTGQVRHHLEDLAYQCVPSPEPGEIAVDRGDGLAFLRADPNANLGWRIIVEDEAPPFFREAVRTSVAERGPLADALPAEFRVRILAEAGAYEVPAVTPAPVPEPDMARPTIKFASFEGSKGLSAQHVFVVGLHDGDLPRTPAAVTDLEICKLIVAITRTRKQCHLLSTRRWGTDWKRPSQFLQWIRRERVDLLSVTKEYWERSGRP